MVDVYIYGAGDVGKRAYRLFTRLFPSDLKIIGFIDEYKSGNIFNLPIMRIDEVNDRRTLVIIAIEDRNTARFVWNSLKRALFSDIRYFVEKGSYLPSNIQDFKSYCMDCSNWKYDGATINGLEMHVVDYCNLNCKGCTHFSPIFPKVFPSYQERMAEIRNLAAKVEMIKLISIMGGEPLLNPNLNEYVIQLRKMLPFTRLFLITNGLLIPKIDRMLLRNISLNGVKVIISDYQPTHKIIREICTILEEYHIEYEIRDTQKYFVIPLSLSQNSKYTKGCISDKCNMVWKGKIARCPTLMFIGEFNRHFSTAFPEDGVIDLSSRIAGWDLVNRLRERVPLCDYCVINKVSWQKCGNVPQLSDFVVPD